MNPQGQQIMQDIYHQQREQLAPAILAEIQKRSEALAAASPAGRLRFVQAPVLLLHGSDDSIIPPSEMLWLKQDIPGDQLVDALESPAIGHVDFGAQISWRDRVALVQWMAMMMHTARNSSASKGLAHAPAGIWIVPGVPHQAASRHLLP
jgi:pimeloyl-ACP methyl ester carboxylesterase